MWTLSCYYSDEHIMLLSNTILAVKPSKFDHDVINIHSSTTQHYGRNTALRGRLAALGFTPLFTRVQRLSECRFDSDWRCVSCRNGCSGNGGNRNGGSRNGCGRRQEAGQQSQANPGRTRPNQGTVGGPEQGFPVSTVPLRQQSMVPWQATGHLD